MKFLPMDGKVRLSLEESSEATNEEEQKTSWVKDCQVCGEMVVCSDEEVFSVNVREFERDGSVVRVLDVDPVVVLSDRELYLVRHGHEVLLKFGADPTVVDKGSLDISIRKLEKGATVQQTSTTYETTSAQVVRLELPGDAGGLAIKFRDQDRRPDAGGSGRSRILRRSLFDYETLKTHPKMMRQPSSLEITENEKAGFNLPH